MDLNNVKLPEDVRAFMIKSLTDRNLPLDDPLAGLLLAQVSMNEMQNKRLWSYIEKQGNRLRGAIATCIFVAIVALFGGYFFGRWAESQETLRARTMVAINEPGLSMGYGIVSGQKVVMVSPGKDKILNAWAKAGRAYILVQ
jgi:hypothetical protein